MLAVNQPSGLDGVYDKQGTFYSNGPIIDPNGNEINEAVSSDLKTTQWFDTLSGTTPVLTISAPNWLNGPITYTFANANGGTSIYTEKYTTLAPPPNPGCGYGYFVYSMQVPQELDLPNGQSFVFGYDVEGRVQSVKLPTGSTIHYSYGPMSCVNNTPTSMTRQVDSQPAWQYTQTQNVLTDPLIVTATDPAGNQTQYTFRTFDRYETERKFYQGSVSGGTLLRTVDTCYSGATFPCTSNPSVPITEESVFTTLDNGRQRRVDTHYAYVSTLMTEQDQYDFGASTPTRKTLISYNAPGDFPRPTEVQILDASGVKRADTTIAYDEGTLVASGITTQLSTPTRPRGNPTTISRWIGGSGWVTEKRTYYDTGKLASDTDPNQNTTNYFYDAAYAGAWLTRIEAPAISGTQYANSFAYDPATGLMTSSTDENGNVTR